MQKMCVLIFYCTFHEIQLLLIVKGGAINFDALHQLLYLYSLDIDFIHSDIHSRSCKKNWYCIQHQSNCRLYIP